MKASEFKKYRDAAQDLYEAMAAFFALLEIHPDGITHLLTPKQKMELRQIEDQIDGLNNRATH